MRTTTLNVKVRGTEEHRDLGLEEARGLGG